MTTPTPIACSLHDHLEVACLYRYELTLDLRGGQSVSGRARTTRTAAGGREFLILDTDGGERGILMTDIAGLRVTTAGARFRELIFDKAEA